MPLSNQFHFGSSGAAGLYEYQVENSVYISKASNSHLYRDFGTPTTDGKWTFSAWIKRGNINYFSTSYASSATTGSRMKYFGAAVRMMVVPGVCLFVCEGRLNKAD